VEWAIGRGKRELGEIKSSSDERIVGFEMRSFVRDPFKLSRQWSRIPLT